MKIAVTYDNGNIFAHFGRTENFKVYEIEDNKIASSEVIGAEGAAHGALAGVLAEHNVDVLICGGLGEGAKSALEAEGIEVLAGAEGSADEAVASFLEGVLESTGANCDHHHEEEEGCGSCGGGCGGCGGGCGGTATQIMLEGKNAGKLCTVHYKGTFNDGEQFDSSYDRGQPLEFICGAGMMIPGFDKAVCDMQVGQVIDIHLMPHEAYGEKDPRAIFAIETAKMPGSENLEIGAKVYLQNQMGQSFPALVTAREGETITFDANNEMAGKELNFTIELVSAVEG